MAKIVFKKGDFVRKCTTSGTPIGPYFRVVTANAYQVHVESPECKTLSGVLDRKHVYKARIARLNVSVDIIKRIKERKTDCVSHAVSKKWYEVLTKRPEVVEFYSMDGMNKLFCTLDDVKTYMTSEGSRIYIIIGRTLC